MKKEILGVVSLAILVFVLSLPSNSQADVQNTTTSVTVNEYVAVGLSNNLSAGINFGSLDINTNDNNATANYDGPQSNTTYWVNISSDSNVNVDICVGDNESLATSGYTIENGNYTWVNSTSNSSDAYMATGNSIAMTLTASFTKAGVNIGPGNNDWFRFWLDIPQGQAAGTYGNAVSFKGIKTGNSCN